MFVRVLPGGEHADGLTSNALVVLSDGVYLELIAFTHDVAYYASDSAPDSAALLQKRKDHWWARKSPGWIDWANLGYDQDLADHINSRAKIDGVEVSYQQPIEGGRTKPDGDVLRWRVTFPALELGRGGVPFFCEDLTPRERRVSRIGRLVIPLLFRAKTFLSIMKLGSDASLG